MGFYFTKIPVKKLVLGNSQHHVEESSLTERDDQAQVGWLFNTRCTYCIAVMPNWMLFLRLWNTLTAFLIMKLILRLYHCFTSRDSLGASPVLLYRVQDQPCNLTVQRVLLSTNHEAAPVKRQPITIIHISPSMLCSKLSSMLLIHFLN